jgi:cytoskeletal protein CcmA (bactofilin family)
MILNSPYITGSITVTGNANVQGTLTVTGSLSGTATSASLALNSNLLEGTGSVGFSTTASLLAVSSSQQQISSSLLNVIANYATTGSNSFRADQSITGSLVVSSTITAQTLVVQTVTSSIVYSSGSNIFGSALGDRQTFTGSLNVTGSLALAGNITGNAITLTGALSGTSATFSGNVQVGGSAISGNSNSFYNTATETSVAIKQTSGATILALALWNNSTTGDSRFLRFFTEATSTYRGSIQYDRPGDRLAIYGGGSGLFFDGAATFSSTIAATQFNVSTSGGTTQIYNTGGGHTVITNATANKDMNIQTSGTGGQYFNTAGVDRLIIASTGNVLIGNDANPYIEIANGGSTDVKSGLKWMVGSGRTYYGAIELATPSASNSYLSFSTMNSGTVAEKMRITSGGNVTIGPTSLPSGAVEFNAGSLFTSNNIFVNNSSGTAGYAVRIDGYSNNLYILWSTAAGADNGGVGLAYGATSWSPVSSDVRTKKNFETTQGLTEIKKRSSIIYYQMKMIQLKDLDLKLKI